MRSINAPLISGCLLLLLSLACLGCNGPGSAPTPSAIEAIPTASPIPAETRLIPAETSAIPTGTASPWAPITSGDHTCTLNADGLEREYILHIPPGYDPLQPTALVLAYHGYNLSSHEMMRISGFSAQADSDNFLVAYPQGSGTRPSWNGGNCCGEALLRQVDDVGFTRAMIEDIARLVNLDRSRVFATGFSNGAIMVYRLACDLSDQIAAIGPIGASPATNSCDPGRQVSVIHFHGDADTLNPYEGGPREGGLPDFLPVEEGIALWLGFNNCPQQAQETQEGNIVHRIYSPCQGGTAVELYKILGGEHAWPGGEAVSAAVGVPTDEIDATALMWEFFSEHPMP